MMLPGVEIRDLAEEIEALFDDLRRSRRGAEPVAVTGECTPALDVVETDEAIEIVVDLPGIPASALRLMLKGSTLLIAGEKPAPQPERWPVASFHLLERSSGRFARAVRLTGAFDGGRARATLQSGELRIRLPKIAERRGRAQIIPISRPDVEA